MNLFRKKIISLALVVSLFVVAGGFCYASTASAATNSEIGITQHGKNMAKHGHEQGDGVKLCCVDNGISSFNNSILSIKNKFKLATSEIIVEDASFQSLHFYRDNINISSMSPPIKGDILASVVKKE